ncbi:MAG TPA: NAD(P)/FAD-dependent oxidoreductase [Nocardioides sp.]|nr:NAD(P)/FAD-dependent oxidoreductase [Nocardioides sp.]
MTAYDVIVVGARCAGSPTAMLLARRGLRVLVVDRARFPSDTVSTHILHPLGVAALQRWGLMRAVAGCPAIDTYYVDFGPISLTGAPGTPDSPVAYAPRRTDLDAVLVEGAAEAGVEVRAGFTVTEVLVEDDRVVGIRGRDAGGGTVTERARVVIGADGLHSIVAETVHPEEYRERPRLLAGYYGYWSGLPMDGVFETYVRPPRGVAAWATSNGLTVVIAGWPYAEFARNKTDAERHYRAALDLMPDFAERIAGARLETRVVGAAVPNYFRKPFGPGWALVGDAGYLKDFITGQGMQDAFRDAELCATAVADALEGRRPFESGMADYQAVRDAAVNGMYDLTCELAMLEPPPPEMAQLFGSLVGDQVGMDLFARVCAGVTPPEELFAHAAERS